MSKTEFLAQLRAKLAGRMDEEELSSALSYYEEYLEDAGPEREGEVLEELGSPEAVAAQVLGEQGKPFTPPKARRGSRTGIIALCIGLGVVLVGVTALVVLSFAGWQTYVGEPQVSASMPVVVEPQVSASAPHVSATPVVREDGEKGYMEVSSLDAFTKITVEVGIGAIVLEEGAEYALSMDWFLNTADLKYDDKEGTLKIWSAISGMRDQRGGTIRITVPTGTTLEKVDFQTGLGEIELRDCTVSEKVKAFTGLGNIEVSGSFTGEIDLEVGMGDIDVSLFGAAEDYQIDLETGLGKVKVDGQRYGTSYETGKGAHELDCSTGLGDISVDLCEK